MALLSEVSGCDASIFEEKRRGEKRMMEFSMKL